MNTAVDASVGSVQTMILRRSNNSCSLWLHEAGMAIEKPFLESLKVVHSFPAAKAGEGVFHHGDNSKVTEADDVTNRFLRERVTISCCTWSDAAETGSFLRIEKADAVPGKRQKMNEISRIILFLMVRQQRAMCFSVCKGGIF